MEDVNSLGITGAREVRRVHTECQWMNYGAAAHTTTLLLTDLHSFINELNSISIE